MINGVENTLYWQSLNEHSYLILHIERTCNAAHRLLAHDLHIYILGTGTLHIRVDVEKYQ